MDATTPLTRPIRFPFMFLLFFIFEILVFLHCYHQERLAKEADENKGKIKAWIKEQGKDIFYNDHFITIQVTSVSS